MATEKIVFETEVKTGNSATSVKSVKAELRELKSAMAGLDSSSQEFVKMAQRAGQLEDAIGDANAAVKAFNPEAKLKAVGDVVGVVANGFAAAQGAMAMFGGESEELEELMVRTQGAIALATGINGLMGMGDAMTNLSNVIKTKVVTAFGTMRSAIISTGILGLVVLIGTLIYSWLEEKEANEEATKELERFGEAQRKLLDQEQKIQIERAKGRDKDILSAANQAQQNIRAFQQELKDKKITQEEFNKLVKGEQELMRIQMANINKKYDDEEDRARKEKLEKEKKAREERKRAEEERFNKYMEQLKKELEANSYVADKKYEDSKKAVEDSFKKWDEEEKKRNERREKIFKAAKDETTSLEQRQEDLKYFLDAGYISEKEYTDGVKALDKERADFKVEQLKAISAALGGYAQLLGEQTAAGKALAVAQTTIDTYLSASAAFKNVMESPLSKFLPDGGLSLAIFAAGGAVAAGLANVKKILSVQVPGGGGGGSVPSAGGQSVPQFNPAVAQQVQGGGDITLGQKPQRVYVVESDIRGTMNKVDVIEANATIG